MSNVADKILFVVFQTKNRSNGGVESISQIIQHLVNWKCFLLTNQETPRNQSWMETNIKLQVSGADITGSLPKKLWSIITQNARTYRFIRDHQIKLVHSNDIRSMITSAFGAKIAGAKLVFNVRDIKAPGDSYGPLWHVANYLADHLLLLSSEMQEQITQRLRITDKQNLSYQYSIVDFTRFFPYKSERKLKLRENLNIQENALAIGIVAAFMPKKQQLAFIQQAAPLIVDSISNVVIYFIGDFDTTNNAYAQECLKAARDNGSASHLRFVGYQSNVPDWYNLLDVTLVVSEREGLARCMIESISCGTPVISFDVCSAREILEANQCGMVVKQGNYQGLVDSVHELSEKKSTYQKFSKNGYQISRSLFNKDDIVNHYEQLYKSLLY